MGIINIIINGLFVIKRVIEVLDLYQLEGRILWMYFGSFLHVFKITRSKNINTFFHSWFTSTRFKNHFSVGSFHEKPPSKNSFDDGAFFGELIN